MGGIVNNQRLAYDVSGYIINLFTHSLAFNIDVVIVYSMFIRVDMSDIWDD